MGGLIFLGSIFAVFVSGILIADKKSRSDKDEWEEHQSAYEVREFENSMKDDFYDKNGKRLHLDDRVILNWVGTKSPATFTIHNGWYVFFQGEEGGITSQLKAYAVEPKDIELVKV